MRKKVLALVIVLTMIFSLSVPVAAQTGNDPVQPMYNYTKNVIATISITNGTATCYTQVNGYTGTTTKIEIEMTLQKKTVLWWSGQQTWTSTTNGPSASLTKTASVSDGTYRVKAVVTVYSGTNSEKITVYGT